MAYFKDWFGREAEHAYTKYDSSKRAVNWDKGYDNYSDYFFGGRTNKASHKVQDAVSLLLPMSRVLDVTRDRFSKGDRPDNNKVTVPTNLLKDPKITTDVFLGAALQNMAHFSHMDARERSLDKRMKSALNLQKMVYNTLNAERINNIMAEETPGYLKFVQKFKQHSYKSRPEIDPENKFQRAVELFDRVIRYPENLTDEELEEFKEPLDFIKKKLEEAGGIPENHAECMTISKKISKILEKYIIDEEEEQPPSDGDSDEESDKSDGDSESSGSGLTGPPGSSESKPKPTLKDFESTSEEFMEKLLDSMAETKEQDSDTFDSFKAEMKREEESGSTGKIDADTSFIIAKDSPIAYDAASKAVNHTKASVIAKLLKRKNRDYKFSLKSMRSGRLDTDKLAEARQGVQTIYERMGSIKTNKLCVTILVDESGSMCGDKIQKAREAAIFLKEAMETVPDVELFVYGHSADQRSYKSTEIYVYKEPGTFVPPKAMGSLSARSQNRDGVAIIATAKRVRSKTQNQGVFIVISDGSPSACNYGGSSAANHVKRMAIETEKMGFQVIQVTIGGYHSKDMFKNVIQMNDMSKFPTEFTNFLKTKIDHMIKEKISL